MNCQQPPEKYCIHMVRFDEVCPYCTHEIPMMPKVSNTRITQTTPEKEPPMSSPDPKEHPDNTDSIALTQKEKDMWDVDPVARSTEQPAADMVNHPPHYTQHPSGIECIQITEHMGFNLGNALKYIWRADLKGTSDQDMHKAIWYIERELKKRERQDTHKTQGLVR